MTSRRWTLLILVLVGVFGIAVFAALFDFNTLRGPMERYASKTLQREVKIGGLDVRLGFTPLVRVRQLSVANTDWAIEMGEPPLMAQAREIAFTLRLLPLLRGRVVLPHVRLTDAQAALLRLQDGRANFLFGPQDKPQQAKPPALEILALRVDAGRLAYRDEAMNLQLQAQAQTQPDPDWPTQVHFDGRFNRSAFKGQAQTGNVLSVRNTDQVFPVRFELMVEGTTVRADGEITDIATLERIDADFFISGPSLGNLYPTLRIALPASPPYKLQGRLRKDGKRYAYSEFAGTVGDSDVSGDGEFVIEDPRPRLTATLRSKTLRIGDLGPLVGAGERADDRATRAPGITGARSSQARPAKSNGRAAAAPRAGQGKKNGNGAAPGPKATAGDANPKTIPSRSGQRNAASRSSRSPERGAHPAPPRGPVGPIPPPDPVAHGAPLHLGLLQWPAGALATVSTRAPLLTDKARPDAGGQPNAAADPPQATRDGRPANAPARLLPDVDLDPERLRAIDADVRIEVQTLLLPAELAFRNVVTRVRLDNARLAIEPLRFRFAGGDVVASLQLDGTRQPVAASFAMDLRRINLPDLFAAVPKMKESAGRLGARIKLKGQGLSVADLLGTASGSVTLGMDGGRVSRLALAAASLNGGRLLQLLIGGDELTPIRCMGVNVDFKSGIGQMNQFVFDTEQVIVHGDGLINLQLEVFEAVLKPQPKEAGLLSLRAPVRLRGSFRGIELQVDKTAMLRGGAAVALGLLNPLAALLPLIETGPGEDSDCRAVLAPVQDARKQAANPSTAAPQPDAPRTAPAK